MEQRQSPVRAGNSPQALPPAAPGASSCTSLPALTFYDRQLNDIQQACVQRIVSGGHHPHPYIVFGPPGTGKTKTVAEAICQILKLHPTARILACAPSNSAADVLLDRVLKNVRTLSVYRLNAVGRGVHTIPEELKKYCSLAMDGLHFRIQSRKEIMDAKPSVQLVVTTCVSAGALYNLGFQIGDFHTVFVDEAGHATEPECLCAIGGLVSPQQGRIVLSGDPKQLGPIIRSKLATRFGLNISLLERLTRENGSDDTSPNAAERSAGQPADRRSAGAPNVYSRGPGNGPYDPTFLTKLLYNYRSHPDILKVPNELFYANELQAHANKLERQSLLQAAGFWPNPQVPVLFHHVEGKEEQEARSPSWFNRDEAIQLVAHAFDLMGQKKLGLTYRDVGVISPYAKQVHKLRDLIRSRHDKLNGGTNSSTSSAGLGEVRELKVGSTEEFQGQERKLILISTVRSTVANYESFDVKYQLGFVNEPKRLNVALTRAKAGLIVVGNGTLLARDRNWRAFLRFCVSLGAVKGGLTSRDLDDAASGDGIDPPVMPGADALVDLIREAQAHSQREQDRATAREREQEAKEEIGQRKNPDAPFNRDE